MHAHTYTEDQLVEQPAIGLFTELGWTTMAALEEFFGRSRGDETHLSPAASQSLLTSSPRICLGRETKGEVLLVSQLRAALERLSARRAGRHALPPEAIAASGLIERLTAGCRKSLISSRFLFE